MSVSCFTSCLEKARKRFLPTNRDNCSNKILNFNEKYSLQVKAEDDVEAKKEDVEKADQETKDEEAVEGIFQNFSYKLIMIIMTS